MESLKPSFKKVLRRRENEKKHIAASGYDIDDLAVLLRGSVRQTGREQLAGRSDGPCRNVGCGDCSACGDGFCRIASLGGKYYVRAEMLTDVLPASAEELMAKNGGVYYKGVRGLVAIDAGHQGKGMNGKEPLGPGSETLKKMLSTGTQGVATRIPEYVLNLEVSLRLRNELISRGYGVVMIRESHSVTLSNSQRAKIANAYGADIFIRVHANGSTDRTVRGAYGICMTEKNQFNAALHSDSLRLSECVADELCRATGVVKKKTWQTDTMTGINWPEVPVTIIEMGYMSNPDEDRLMETDEFRNSAAAGIANGVDGYFAGR